MREHAARQRDRAVLGDRAAAVLGRRERTPETHCQTLPCLCKVDLCGGRERRAAPVACRDRQVIESAELPEEIGDAGLIAQVDNPTRRTA